MKTIGNLFGTSLFLLTSLISVSSCVSGGTDEACRSFRTWEDIKNSDTLRIGTTTSPSAFFIYRGKEMGSEFLKIRDFAANKGLNLKIKLSHSLDTLKHWIQNDSIDLCITPMAMTRNHMEEFLFCGPTRNTSLVLLQRKGAEKVSSVLDLVDKKIHVVRNSVEAFRLQQIDDEIGPNKDFTIGYVDTLSVPDLLTLVGQDSIDYTVSDRHIADMFARHYKGLDVKTKLSTPIRYGWVTQKGNTSLADTLGVFFSGKNISKEAENTMNFALYFGDPVKRYAKVNIPEGAISPYDDLFIRESKRLGWHWTILAAIAFQESGFQSDIVGWSSATGLMGIMPATGRAFGATVEELKDPAVSVRVSVDCLLAIGKSYQDIQDEEERMKFILASYNAGPAHIQDARRLARKYGASADVWDNNVREYVLLKSNPKYYNDPVCKYGFLRGRETVAYVSNIMSRKDVYRALMLNKEK